MEGLFLIFQSANKFEQKSNKKISGRFIQRNNRPFKSPLAMLVFHLLSNLIFDENISNAHYTPI